MELGEVGITRIEAIAKRGFIFQDQNSDVFVVLEHIQSNQYKCQFIGRNGVIEYHDFLEDGN